MQKKQRQQMKKQELKKLRDEWDIILKEAGFDDIENRKREDSPLKQYHAYYFQARYTPETFVETKLYYQQCKEFANVYKFENEQDKQIWDLYADGLSLRDMETWFKTNKVKYKSKDTLGNKINQIKKELMSWLKVSKRD